MDGARAIDDAAAAAATRILQKHQQSSFIFLANRLSFTETKKNLLESNNTFYVHQHIHQFHQRSPPT